MATHLIRSTILANLAYHAAAAGFRTVGSSGCTVQMTFVQPYTDNVIFLDNYHPNFGGPGVNLETGVHSPNAYNYDGTDVAVFSTEFNSKTHELRKLRPRTNTFCSAGAFFPDGTMVNPSGAEPDPAKGVGDGFDAIRFYAPGPCNGKCNDDWVEDQRKLQARRWYPTTVNLVNGDIAVIGGSNVGLLVLNEANINVPTYELLLRNGKPAPPVTLPILEFNERENNQPNKSYNLYPLLHLLPNDQNKNEVFTLAGNQAIIWDYVENRLIKQLPNVPLQPRCFPSSATGVMLPLEAPNFDPTILICGGSSADIPDIQALDDCYTIQPYASNAQWQAVDNLPNGPQTMSDGILLPDGTILILNGGHTGSGGGFMADDPVLAPVIYNPKAPAGSRFTTMPKTNIPRMYHSVATLLPSGEVLVAGSNPMVFYTADGGVPGGWPKFGNNGHEAFLNQQQRQGSKFPTEYRVEIFSPPYIDARTRPSITAAPETINFNKSFEVQVDGATGNSMRISLSNPGFHTHAVAMTQTLVFLAMEKKDGKVSVTAPPNGSVAPPGVYLLFVTVDGVPSEGRWVKLE